jgi:hypothetical protein
MRQTDEEQFYALFEGQRGMGVVPVDAIPDSFRLLRGEVRLDAPLAFRHSIGRVPRDLIMGGDVSLLLISEYFRSVLAAQAFTGWTIYPVEVYTKRGEIIPDYAGLSIIGRSRPIGRLAVPGLVRAWPDELVRRTWAGDDLFLDGGSAQIVVTRRVRDALRASRISNVSFVPVG